MQLVDSKTYVIAPFTEHSCFPFEVTDKLLCLIDKEPLTEEESKTLDECFKTIIEMTSADKVYVSREEDVLYIKVINGAPIFSAQYHREVPVKPKKEDIMNLILKRHSKTN